MARPEWKSWSDLPWQQRSGNNPEVNLCIRLLEAAGATEGLTSYLRGQLPEISAEFAAQWSAVLLRGAEWTTIAEFGRQPLERFPWVTLTEVLDRDSACCFETEPQPGGQVWTLMAVPLHKGAQPPELLVMCGRSLQGKMLPHVMTVARALSLGMTLARRWDNSQHRVDRLKATLRIASTLGSTRETVPLLELIAREASRLLDADRSSIFIWDREQREMVACPALGVEGNMLRLPETAGIAGECLQTGQVIRVDDAYADPRFNKQVDVASGYRTRNLLCVPLEDPDGQRIGVFEAINKKQGPFTSDDVESLAELGTQAAVALRNTREREQLVRRHQQLTEQVTQGVRIIGKSPAIEALRKTVEKLATTDLPVLIRGESGTGKEVVAQWLHYGGPRQHQPFIAVNCAALTETLLESELFGHEKGAFTDAHDTRQGKFELANGGTLFLDEIGDMSQSGQAKLLRVLEEKVITRVGGSQPIRTNVRVVAATNVNLANAVREKRFREDLYYRLSVVELKLPPLRDRTEDIVPLAEYFLDRFCAQAGRRTLSLSIEASKRLEAHSWPGNIRELRNLMERVSFLCQHDRVEIEDLAFIISPESTGFVEGDTSEGLNEATTRFQSEYIRRMLKRVHGNMSEAARSLGLHRSNLYRKMRHLGMKEADDAEHAAG